MPTQRHLAFALASLLAACAAPGRQDVVYYDIQSDVDFGTYTSFRRVENEDASAPDSAAETIELALDAAEEELVGLGLERVRRDADLELVVLTSAADPDATEQWACEKDDEDDEDWAFWGTWAADWAPCGYLDPVSQPYTDGSVLVVLRDVQRTPSTDADSAVFGGLLVAVADGFGNDAARIRSGVARLFSYYPQ